MPFKNKTRKPHYDRAYYLANRDWILARSRAYNTTHKKVRLRWAREYYAANRTKKRAYGREQNAKLKLAALTRYGKNGELLCCWEHCQERDIDILTLDHIHNDGAKHRRRISGTGCGYKLYSRLKVLGYPPGFQTLCANHQLKKEMIRRRQEMITLPNVTLNGVI